MPLNALSACLCLGSPASFPCLASSSCWLDREAHKSQVEHFLLPQFVPRFYVLNHGCHLGWLPLHTADFLLNYISLSFPVQTLCVIPITWMLEFHLLLKKKHKSNGMLEPLLNWPQCIDTQHVGYRADIYWSSAYMSALCTFYRSQQPWVVRVVIVTVLLGERKGRPESVPAPPSWWVMEWAFVSGSAQFQGSVWSFVSLLPAVSSPSWQLTSGSWHCC